MIELVPNLNEISVDPRKLILDPNNPRLITKDEDRREAGSALDLMDETVTRMRDDKNKIEEIERSIKENGWLPIDYIFVRVFDDQGRYLVLEGNRRITAIRNLLLDEDLGEVHRETLNAIDVMEITDDLPPVELQKKITYLLGVRHHGSLKKWSPFAQAHNIYKRYMEVLGVKEDEFHWVINVGKHVADALSIELKEVKTRLQVYCAMRQIGNDKIVRESEKDGGGIKDRYYSVCAEVVLNQKRYGDYINQEAESFTLTDDSVDRMVNLCHFDRKNRQDAPISNPVEWRKLGQILSDEDPERKIEMLHLVEEKKQKPSDVYAERAAELQTLQWDHWLTKVHSILKQVTIDDIDADGAYDAVSNLATVIEKLDQSDRV